MPRNSGGAWVDKDGKPIMLKDCVDALHDAITRLTWEINFGEKTKDDPQRKAMYEKDVMILETIKDSFQDTLRKVQESGNA